MKKQLEDSVVVVGSPVIIHIQSSNPVSVMTAPLAGGSMTIHSTLSSKADIDSGVAIWIEWDTGVSASNEMSTTSGSITAIMATATIANGTVFVSV